MGDTKIQWTGKTWNPIRARNKATGKVGWFCEHVSEGCRNCYAEKMNVNTYFGNGLNYKPASLDQVELFLDDTILQQPLHWRKATKVFPCSMTDAFGRFVTDEWLDRMMAVAALAKQHTFQFLTKRADRAQAYMLRLSRSIEPLQQAARSMGYSFKFTSPLNGKELSLLPWPIPNVWLGVSVEDQKTADERIPLLLQTPAAVRWISAEPLLGPINLSGDYLTAILGKYPFKHYSGPRTSVARMLDWVVVGGESGPKARGLDLSWARSVVRQCAAASIPVFVKQLGAHPFERKPAEGPQGVRAALANIEKPHPQRLWFRDGWTLISKGEVSEWIKAIKLTDKKGGDINEWPVDLQVREFPTSLTTEGV